MRFGVGIVVACVVMVASAAQAHDVSVRVDGCDGAETATVAAALALELGAGWRVVPELDAPMRIEVSIADCAATTWSARVLDARGEVLRGPAELAMGGFPSSGRARIAALWIAEWLATITPEGAVEIAVTDVAADTGAAAHAAPETTPPIVADPAAQADAPITTEITTQLATPRDDAPLLVRFVALASFRQVPGTPATLGGGDLAVQIARGGTIGLGVELGAGVESGKQWSYDLLLVRGTLSAFVLLGGTDWIEIDVGARAALEHLPSYTRGAFMERLSGTLHGYLGSFVRTLIFVVPGVSIAVDLEFAGGLTPITYHVDQPPGYELPDDYDELLGGFSFAARAGIVIQ